MPQRGGTAEPTTGRRGEGARGTSDLLKTFLTEYFPVGHKSHSSYQNAYYSRMGKVPRLFLKRRGQKKWGNTKEPFGNWVHSFKQWTGLSLQMTSTPLLREKGRTGLMAPTRSHEADGTHCRQDGDGAAKGDYSRDRALWEDRANAMGATVCVSLPLPWVFMLRDP